MLKEISQGQKSKLDSIVESQTVQAKENELFLAAGGYYQLEYISSFRSITEPDAADYLLNEYDIAKYIADLFFDKLKNEYKGKIFNFNKIFSVTIPSQIIAKFLFERLEREFYTDNEIKFYSNKEGIDTYERKLPLLVRLSSYYSFDEDVNFQSIKAGDRVLIINDVISTGSLITNILNNISSKVIDESNTALKAKVDKILTFIDTRISEEEITSLIANKPELKRENICGSVFFNSNPNLTESDIISLVKKNVVKFKHRPEHLKDAKLIRINPILNAPVTFPSRHSEEDKIAFKNPIDFLEQLPSKDLKIGHFQQNSLHHPYFIKPNDLFRKDPDTGIMNSNGIELFHSVISRVYQLEHSVNVNYYLESLTHQLASLKTHSHLFNNANSKTEEQFEIAHNEIKKLSDFVEIDKNYNLNSIKNKLKVDYVFRPVFSGIELLSRNDITEFCDVELNNIIELHRFDTIKGWHFIIPPKFLNDSLVNKTALILDMGSFTGDSIIQMVDALSVYQLSKIIVVSLVGRIEDFDREFLSRMREIKVKRRKVPNERMDNLPDNTVANINIYFGTNIHIPPYPSIKVCELCKEKDRLHNYLEAKECIPTVRNYIVKRKEELQLFHVNEIGNQCPTYFPENKTDIENKYDTLLFYKIRDDLGKIDGYRFYEDYYYYFDKLTIGSENYERDMEAIMAICLHENHLLTTIKNQLPDIYNNLQNFIDEIICANSIDLLKYKWKKKELLKFHLIINESKLLNSGLNQILDFIEDCSTCKEQLLFFIWEKHFEYRKEISKKFLIYEFRDNVFEAKKKFSPNQESLLTEIFRICEQFNYNAKTVIDLSFFQLRRFFISESSLNNQYEANGNRIISHPSIYNDVNTTKIPLNLCLRDLENYENYISQFKNEWIEKEKLLFTELIEPLNNIKHFIISCDINSKFLFIRANSPDNIENLITQINSIVSNTSKSNVADNVILLRNCIDSIMDKYLNISSEFAKYCMRFFCNPISILNDFLSSSDLSSFGITTEKIKTNFKEVIEIDKHYQVNIHADIISAVFKEVFTNYSKYGNSSNLDIDGFISDNSLVIKFKQFSFSAPNDKSEIDDSNKVCLSNLVNGLLDGFGVKFYISFDNSGKAFIIQIEVPIYKTVNYGSNK